MYKFIYNEELDDENQYGRCRGVRRSRPFLELDQIGIGLAHLQDFRLEILLMVREFLTKYS